MPTYEYVCTDCGDRLEVVQSIHEPSLVECPSCTGRLRKVFGNVGVVFKGSGFYRTDSRGKGSAGAKPSAGAPSTPSGDSASSDKAAATSSSGSTPSTGSAAKPAPAAASAAAT